MTLAQKLRPTVKVLTDNGCQLITCSCAVNPFLRRDLSDTPAGSAAVHPCTVLICFSTRVWEKPLQGSCGPDNRDTGGIECSLQLHFKLVLGCD